MKVLRIPSSEGDVDYLRCQGMDDKTIAQTYHGYIKEMVREYRIMSNFKNEPNIVHVEDFFVESEQDGLSWTLYIRMELITPIMKDIGCITTEAQILAMAKDITKALVACHKRNVLHRDIKPANIFIDDDDNFKLGDFGVSKISEHTTHATAAIGTYNYMSPEVLVGSNYGVQADIYSLGILMYWALNKKRLPFLPLPPEPYTASMSEEARRRRHRGEPVPPPVNGSLAFKKVVMKACEFDAKNRYLTAQNLLDALNSVPIPSEDPKVPLVTPPDPPDDPKHPLLKRFLRGCVVAAIVLKLFDIGADYLIEKQFGKRSEDVGNTVAVTTVATEETNPEVTEAIAVEATEPKVRSDHIVSVDASPFHVLARYSDGTVDFVTGDTTIVGGRDHNGFRELENVAELYAGHQHTVVLKTDGTVASFGGIGLKGGNVSDWTDITDIAAGSSFTAGLRSDGSVLCSGEVEFDVSGLQNVKKIDAPGKGLDCLLEDGTWMRFGDIHFGSSMVINNKTYTYTDSAVNQENVVKYDTDYTDISTGFAYSIGLKPNGTVDLVKNVGRPEGLTGHTTELLQGNHFNASGWKDIVAVSSGYDQLLV